MSNYNSLKTTIDANIKQNGNQEITGQILNSVLNQMVTTLGAGYQFAGVATLDPATDPGSPDAKVFYIANGKGKYEKFGGLEVTEDDVVVLYWDSAWHKVATGIASQEKLSELDNRVTDIEIDVDELNSGVFNDTNYSNNIRINIEGKEYHDNRYITTDYVDIFGSVYFKIELDSSDANTRVSVFDENKTFIDSYSLNGYETSGRTIKTLENYKYVKVTFKKEVSETDRIYVAIRDAGGYMEQWRPEISRTSLSNFDNRIKKIESGSIEQVVINYKENTLIDIKGDELLLKGYAVSDYINLSTAWNDQWKVFLENTNAYTKIILYDENKAFLQHLNMNGFTDGRENPKYVKATYMRLVMHMPVGNGNRVLFYNPETSSYDIVAYYPSKKHISENIHDIKENIHDIKEIVSLEKKFSALSVKGDVQNGKFLLTESVHVYPNVALSAHIDGEISNVKIGCGYNGTSFEHYAFYAELTSTEVKIYYVERSEPLIETLTHGLTLTDKTDVSIITDNDNNYARHTKIIITTSNGDVYNNTISSWFGTGNAFIKNDGSSTINVSLSLYPRSINSKLWVFGDSYFSFWNKDRWGYYLFQNGMNNILFNHLSGQSPSEGLEDLKHLLSTGHAPSYIVWCHGMNGASDTIDSDGNPIINATKKEIIDWLVDFCSKNEITLILSTIPTAKVGSSVLLHEGLNNYVRSLGVRYIDFADAVGANKDGTWIEGLCADGVHPTIAGAKVLFGRALCDCPELATNTLM